MIYTGFAGIYDHLMKDVPYRDWADLLDRLMKEHGNGGKKIMDMACGTGEITVLLAQKGYMAAGADISEDMLAVAIQKAEANKVEIPFFNQDMREMEGHHQSYDAVMMNCDSLNYLLEEEDVRQTLHSAAAMLHAGGLLLFDVHSLYKMEHILQGATFADAGEDVSFIWNCFEGDHPYSADHELSFFIKDPDGRYSRIDEFHQQRAYAPEQLLSWLEAEGFEVLEHFSDFTPGTLLEKSERQFYAAKKNRV
ncbi:class I SAM-dependent DNA methyltransferase [Metabacillus sp. 113a]|uniref:class I SAM-dependent DNA methyltransferase n=1 Tax=Metabacillus sp. 113a TaxID=3404706 RepID=UPI003CF3D615